MGFGILGLGLRVWGVGAYHALVKFRGKASSTVSMVREPMISKLCIVGLGFWCRGLGCRDLGLGCRDSRLGAYGIEFRAKGVKLCSSRLNAWGAGETYWGRVGNKGSYYLGIIFPYSYYEPVCKGFRFSSSKLKGLALGGPAVPGA